MIPDEQPVPARVLGAPAQVGDHAGIGEVTEVRHADGEAHDLMLACAKAGRLAVAHYPGGRAETA
jgi:hypothetical protein